MASRSIRIRLPFWRTLLILLWSYVTYHLLVRPALLDLSAVGMILVVAAAFLFFFAVPPQTRKAWAVAVLAFLLLDKGLASIAATSSSWTRVFLYGLCILWLLAAARWYGKLNARPLVAIALAGVLTLTWMPRGELTLLNYFVKEDVTKPLYVGNWDYFPFTVADLDGDGTDEILTVGNRDETLPEGENENNPRDEQEHIKPELEPEPLYPYVLKWRDGHLVREPVTPDQLAAAAQRLPLDTIGYPYFRLTRELTLEPAVQPTTWTEEVMDFGSAPFRVFAADLSHLAHLEATQAGSLSRQHLARAGDYADVRLTGREVTGTYRGRPFRFSSDATKLIGVATLENGQQALVLLGEEIEVWQPDSTGGFVRTHLLTRDDVKGLANGEYYLWDVDGDGSDELVLSLAHAKIVKPRADGTWDVWWAANDEHFRFEDFGSFAPGDTPQLIALDKSYLRDYPLRYPAGFRYTPEGLKREWKIFLPLVNLRLADLDGDGKRELVGLWYNKHQLYVLKPHSVPVIPLLLGGNIVLLAYLWSRRLREARRTRPYALAALVLLLGAGTLLSGCTYSGAPRMLGTPTGDAPAAKPVTPEDGDVPGTPIANAGQRLEAALTTVTAPDIQQFWYDGYIAANLPKRRSTSMYKGAVVLPHGYFVDGRWAGQPFRYYRWDDKRYVFHSERWMKADPSVSHPVNPFGSFVHWPAFFERAVLLPREEVLGVPCDPIQVRLTGREWLERLPEPYRTEVRALVAQSARVADAVEKATVKMTFWVGVEDNRLYQYQVWIKLPLPDAGVMDQEIFFRFYKYNDPGIKLKTPEEMEKLVQESEEEPPAIGEPTPRDT